MSALVLYWYFCYFFLNAYLLYYSCLRKPLLLCWYFRLQPFLRYWNTPADWFTDWLCCTGISLLTDHVVLEYPCWLTILYWNILTGRLCCSGMSLLTDYFVLEYPCWRTILYWSIPADYFVLKYSYWLTILHSNVLTDWLLYWNIPTDWFLCWNTPTSCIFSPEIFFLPDYFVLGSPLLTVFFLLKSPSWREYFLLEYSYWLDIFVLEYPLLTVHFLNWNIRTDWILLAGIFLSSGYFVPVAAGDLAPSPLAALPSSSPSSLPPSACVEESIGRGKKGKEGRVVRKEGKEGG